MKSQKKLITLIVLSIILCCSGQALYADLNVEKHVLSNGMTIILNEQHSRDIISLCLLVDGGGRIESPDVSGISHFIEHLVFRGPTENQDELELRRSFRLYGDFSGYTSSDLTCYGFTSKPEIFDRALDDFVDGVMNLTIPETVIEKERSVVTREIHQRGDIPNVRIWELFYSTALKVHSYHNPVIGYEEIIEKIESDTFREYYSEHYTPDQFVIAITGDFDSETIISRLEGAFSAYSPTGKDFERGIVDPPQTKIHSEIEKADVNAMLFMLGWRIPPANENTSPDLEILAEVLGGGNDSRLYRSLKTEAGLVDEISCFTDFNHDDSFFIVYVTAPEENLEEIREKSLETISAIIENPPTDEEWKRAKQRIENSHAFSLQTYWELSEYLAMWEIFGNLEQGIDWIDLINNSDKNVIPDLYSKYLGPDNYTWVALLPEKKTEPKFADAPFEPETPIIDVLEGEVISAQFNNGAKLIFKYDTASDIVGISVLAGLGQVMESPENRGIGEFTARMLLKGCADLDSTEFRKKTEELGLQITSSGGRDFISVSFEIRKDRLRDGLELLSDVLFNPTFDESEIELVRDKITSGIKRRKDSPFNHVNDEFFSMIYNETPYGFPVEGIEETIARISREDLRNFHSLAFTPKNLTIGVAGDLEYSSWQPVLNKFLGRLFHTSRVDENMDFNYPVEKISPLAYENKTLDLPRAQVSFNMGSIALAADNPDYPALKMLVSILGLRVFDKYVYELGWSYRMWFYMSTRRGPSPVMFEMGVSKDNFDAAKSGLIDAMKEIIDVPISDEEFSKSLNYILQSFHLGMQKNIDMAYNLAFYDKVGLGYKYVLNHDKIYSSLTQADLSRVAKKYFHPDEMKIVAIIPSE